MLSDWADIQLKSALNQPLDAQIEILGATPQDLRDLHADHRRPRHVQPLWSRLSRRCWAASTFSVEKGADGRDVLRVTSPQPVTEPFLTFLVEADWARGRLLREYTVLLDPPVFMPEQTDTGRGRERRAALPRSRARRRQDRTSGRGRRARRGRASGRAHEAVAQAGGGRRWRISRAAWRHVVGDREPDEVRTPRASRANQMMVALYRDNPDAFLGNMNLVKEGALLHVPSSSEINALPSGDANCRSLASGERVARRLPPWRTPAARPSSSSCPPKAGAEGGATPGQASPATSAASRRGHGGSTRCGRPRGTAQRRALRRERRSQGPARRGTSPALA